MRIPGFRAIGRKRDTKEKPTEHGNHTVPTDEAGTGQEKAIKEQNPHEDIERCSKCVPEPSLTGDIVRCVTQPGNAFY